MPRGGYRPFSGHPRKGHSKAEIRTAAAAAGKTPLEYMLAVLNDETADPERRDRMAVAAAPYCHATASSRPGKKEERSAAAKRAGTGKFAPSKPPRLVVDNDPGAA